MVIIDSELTLEQGMRVTVANLVGGAVSVTVHTPELPLTFRVLPDGPGGIRLEQFHPEYADLRLPTWAIAALQAILTQIDWHYIVALYPASWHSVFEGLGFRFLSERVRWEIALAPGYMECTLPEDIYIQPLNASAEHLGKLLAAAEADPSIPLPRYIAFCRALLEGSYGPLIASGSYEISSRDEVFGACLFTNYYGWPLLSHIFIAHTMQGCGFARLLLQHGLDGLAHAGFTRAIASIDVNNTASRLLHERVGFSLIEPVLSCSMVKKVDFRLPLSLSREEKHGDERNGGML